MCDQHFQRTKLARFLTEIIHKTFAMIFMEKNSDKMQRVSLPLRKKIQQQI